MPFSTEPLFGMTIRESATDGSDFTNPAADYRRLFLGEDGQLHLRDSAGAITDIGGGLVQASRVSVTGGNLTTTNTTFEDATGLTTTITTGARRCQVTLTGVGHCSVTSQNYCVDLAIDGARVGQAFGLAFIESIDTGDHPNGSLAFTFLTNVLTAASHTFKIQHRVDGGGATGTLFASTSVSPAIITVIETNLTS